MQRRRVFAVGVEGDGVGTRVGADRTGVDLRLVGVGLGSGLDGSCRLAMRRPRAVMAASRVLVS